MSTTAANNLIEDCESEAITVVIPTFNRRQWLERAAESVLSETRVPIVLHIFDNASSDDTDRYAETLMARDSRVRCTRWPENVGGLVNSQRSIASVSSEYFVPLADDDWLLPGFLYAAYSIMKQRPELGAVVFQTGHLSPEGSIVAYNPPSSSVSGFLDTRAHLRLWMMEGHYQWSSILWRREVIDRIGVPEVNIGLPSDVDYQAQAFARFPVYRVLRPGAVYQLHHAQASSVAMGGKWWLIAKRLDAAVAAGDLIPADEYGKLRRAMIARWQDMWKTNLSLSGARRTVLAAWSLGVRMGDLRFAARASHKLLARKMTYVRDRLGERTR